MSEVPVSQPAVSVQVRGLRKRYAGLPVLKGKVRVWLARREDVLAHQPIEHLQRQFAAGHDEGTARMLKPHELHDPARHRRHPAVAIGAVGAELEAVPPAWNEPPAIACAPRP